jgi:hypothetical protein
MVPITEMLLEEYPEVSDACEAYKLENPSYAASDQVYTQLFAEIHYKKYTSKCLKIQSPTVTIPMFFLAPPL